MKLFESNKPSQFANRFAKRGFLTGAAALSMMEALEGRHAANLARLGYELKDEGRRIATPNTSVTLDPNQVPAVLTPGVGTVQDRQTGFIWDTFTLAANTAFPSITTLFNQQIANRGTNLTNLKDNGKLQYPQRMDVTRLRVYVLNNIALSDLLAIYTNVTFTVQVQGSFNKFEGLPWMMPAGGGAHITGGNQVGTAPVGSSVYHSTGNSNPDIRCSLELPDIIQLGANEAFSTIMQNWTPFTTSANTTNPPGTGVTLVIAFQGDRFLPFGG